MLLHDVRLELPELIQRSALLQRIANIGYLKAKTLRVATNQARRATRLPRVGVRGRLKVLRLIDQAAETRHRACQPRILHDLTRSYTTLHHSTPAAATLSRSQTRRARAGERVGAAGLYVGFVYPTMIAEIGELAGRRRSERAGPYRKRRHIGRHRHRVEEGGATRLWATPPAGTPSSRVTDTAINNQRQRQAVNTTASLMTSTCHQRPRCNL